MFISPSVTSLDSLTLGKFFISGQGCGTLSHGILVALLSGCPLSEVCCLDFLGCSHLSLVAVGFCDVALVLVYVGLVFSSLGINCLFEVSQFLCAGGCSGVVVGNGCFVGSCYCFCVGCCFVCLFNPGVVMAGDSYHCL